MDVVVATDWSVGGPTIALAALTGALAIATFWMARQARAQVTLERERIEAAQQPYVFPAFSRAWDEGPHRNAAIPVTNGGLGVARNVNGRLHFPAIYVALVPTSIAPGDTQDVRFAWSSEPEGGSWAGARGFLLYEDVAGVEWRTDFTYREEGPESGRRRFIEVGQYGRVSDLGDPDADFIRPDVAAMQQQAEEAAMQQQADEAG